MPGSLDHQPIIHTHPGELLSVAFFGTVVVNVGADATAKIEESLAASSLRAGATINVGNPTRDSDVLRVGEICCQGDAAQLRTHGHAHTVRGLGAAPA